MVVTLGFKTCVSSLCSPLAAPPCFFLIKMATAIHEMYIAIWISMGVTVISFVGGILERIKHLS